MLRLQRGRMAAPGALGGKSNPDQFTDAFSRADGSLGANWVGASWGISNNAAVNTPTVGPDELLSDPGLENWTSPSNLTDYSETVAGASTVNQETTEVHGGSNAAKLVVDGSNSNIDISKSVVALAKGDWLLTSVYARCASGSGQLRLKIGESPSSVDRNLSTTYGQIFRTYYLPSTNKSIGLVRGSAATGLTIYADDLSAKKIAPSTLFAVWYKKAHFNYRLNAQVSTVAGASIGLVGSLDNPSNPQNYIAAWIDALGSGGTGSFNVFGAKYAGGNPTALVSGGAGTYVGSEYLELIKYNTTAYIYYKRLLVGTYAVSDAGIINNTKVGMFAAYPSTSSKISHFDYDKVDYLTNVWEIGDSKTVGNNAGSGWGDGDSTYARLGRTVFIMSPAKLATNGWKMADVKAGIDAAIAAATTTPEFCFLNIGYNDAGSTPTTEASWKSDCQYVVDALNAKWPSLRIYLDKGWSSDRAANMAIINTWIDSLVALNAAKNVYVGLDETVWLKNGESGPTYMYTNDGVHPNAAGYTKRAQLRKQLVGH